MRSNMVSLLTMRVFAGVLPAVLAIHAFAWADIQRRELATEVSVQLELASGRTERSSIKAWSEDGIEGATGLIRWEDLRVASAAVVLKACATAAGAQKDAQAAADVVAIAESLPDGERIVRSLTDWARRQGATDTQLTAAKTDAARLRSAREERAKKAEDARLAAISPEAPRFTNRAWKELPPDEFERASAENLEGARAALAKAGTSATLHETTHVALLAEAGDPAFRNDAGGLEFFYARWSEELARAGAPVRLQGKVPVALVADRDRWRLLAASVASTDPARYPDVLVVYPAAANGDPRPLVLVAPNSDRALQLYHASVGLARAMLHSAGAPERGPAWLNEGLPRVMAEIQTPNAAMDEALRRDGLVALRAGTTFVPVLNSTYADAMWTKDFGLAQSMSYMFVRWLYEQGGMKLLRFAKVTAPTDPWQERFKRVYGSSISSAAAAASKWFYTND